MYGEVFTDEDGFVVTVDFGGAFGEKVDLSVLQGVPNTEKLVLNGADISDEDLVHLKELKSLQSLDLGNSSFDREWKLCSKLLALMKSISRERMLRMPAKNSMRILNDSGWCDAKFLMTVWLI